MPLKFTTAAMINGNLPPQGITQTVVRVNPSSAQIISALASQGQHRAVIDTQGNHMAFWPSGEATNPQIGGPNVPELQNYVRNNYNKVRISSAGLYYNENIAELNSADKGISLVSYLQKYGALMTA